MQRLITFDPGHHTGYSVLVAGQLVELGTIELENRTKSLLRLFSSDDDFLPMETVIVVESFRLYPWKATKKYWDDFPEVETIGMIKLLAESKGYTLIIQNPSQKDAYNNALLKAVFPVSKFQYTRHSLDALRHAVVYYIHKEKEGDEIAKNILREIKTALRNKYGDTE